MSSGETPESSSPPEGISLDELTEAFAQAMGASAGADVEAAEDGDATQADAEDVSAVEDAGVQDSVEEPAADAQDDPCEICPRTILEAMLFVGSRENEPLSSPQAAELMRGVEPEEIPGLVEELNRGYSANGCPYYIISTGAGYRMVLRRAFHSLRNRFYGRIREARLSQAAIDVLAIVAYQQPLSGDEVGRLRGKPGGQLLSQLVRRGLLRIEREESKRRTARYFTTDRFLELFGLADLEDLPQSEDLDRQ